MLEQLDYKNVLKYFTEISKVPRGSGYNEKISSYLMAFAKEHGLEAIQDEALNVVINKPATPGYESDIPVIIQGHMDMVCVTEEGCDHDFASQGLDLFVDGDWIGARGTTLGGDDGIAIAYGMALLADETLCHPALQVVITTDEETGMYGAKALDPALLTGRFFINVDSEEEGVVLAGCAGGMRVSASLPLRREQADGCLLSLSLTGLKGGHSGAEIHQYRVNAVYQMARLLFDLGKEQEFLLVSMCGGEKDNAIPCAAKAEILVEASKGEDAMAALLRLFSAYQEELGSREPGMKIEIHAKESKKEAALHPMSAEKLLFLLMQAPDGVQKMSGEIAGLVESSLNLGIFQTTDAAAEFHFSIRSSVSAYKYFLRDKLVYLFEFLGGECECGSEYPAWEYKRNSKLREKFAEVFEDFYGKKPEIMAIHAGLECGLISEKIPDMDMISIGPNMRDIHTPKERLSISSSIRMYHFLETLLPALHNMDQN